MKRSIADTTGFQNSSLINNDLAESSSFKRTNTSGSGNGPSPGPGPSPQPPPGTGGNTGGNSGGNIPLPDLTHPGVTGGIPLAHIENIGPEVIADSYYTSRYAAYYRAYITLNPEGFSSAREFAEVLGDASAYAGNPLAKLNVVDRKTGAVITEPEPIEMQNLNPIDWATASDAEIMNATGLSSKDVQTIRTALQNAESSEHQYEDYENYDEKSPLLDHSGTTTSTTGTTKSTASSITHDAGDYGTDKPDGITTTGKNFGKGGKAAHFEKTGHTKYKKTSEGAPSTKDPVPKPDVPKPVPQVVPKPTVPKPKPKPLIDITQELLNDSKDSPEYQLLRENVEATNEILSNKTNIAKALWDDLYSSGKVKVPWATVESSISTVAEGKQGIAKLLGTIVDNTVKYSNEATSQDALSTLGGLFKQIGSIGNKVIRFGAGALEKLGYVGIALGTLLSGAAGYEAYQQGGWQGVLNSIKSSFVTTTTDLWKDHANVSKALEIMSDASNSIEGLLALPGNYVSDLFNAAGEAGGGVAAWVKDAASGISQEQAQVYANDKTYHTWLENNIDNVGQQDEATQNDFKALFNEYKEAGIDYAGEQTSSATQAAYNAVKSFQQSSFGMSQDSNYSRAFLKADLDSLLSTGAISASDANGIIQSFGLSNVQNAGNTVKSYTTQVAQFDDLLSKWEENTQADQAYDAAAYKGTVSFADLDATYRQTLGNSVVNSSDFLNAAQGKTSQQQLAILNDIIHTGQSALNAKVSQNIQAFNSNQSAAQAARSAVLAQGPAKGWWNTLADQGGKPTKSQIIQDEIAKFQQEGKSIPSWLQGSAAAIGISTNSVATIGTSTNSVATAISQDPSIAQLASKQQSLAFQQYLKQNGQSNLSLSNVIQQYGQYLQNTDVNSGVGSNFAEGNAYLSGYDLYELSQNSSWY
jgi:hypothetical protein